MTTIKKCECTDCEEAASAGWGGDDGFGFCYACDEAGCLGGEAAPCRCEEEPSKVNAALDAG